MNREDDFFEFFRKLIRFTESRHINWKPTGEELMQLPAYSYKGYETTNLPRFHIIRTIVRRDKKDKGMVMAVEIGVLDRNRKAIEKKVVFSGNPKLVPGIKVPSDELRSLFDLLRAAIEDEGLQINYLTQYISHMLAVS